jgi:hypothetical protein
MESMGIMMLRAMGLTSIVDYFVSASLSLYWIFSGYFALDSS